MEIRINGQTADVTADQEKTVGEVLAALEQWLANSGHRLSGLAVDGQGADSSSIEQAFLTEIENVKILDIYTSSIADLAAASLLNLLEDTEEYERLDFKDRSSFYENWKNRAQAAFAAQQMPDLYSLYVDAFSGGAMNCETLRAITEERLREVNDPAGEFANLRPVLEETCARLVDLPLDTQTGKDLRAAETIQIFSAIAEKIFRIFRQFDIQGCIQQETVAQLIVEFGAAVKELLEAYERRDTVLIGDLAEYEMAPRLGELYNVILNNSREQTAGVR
jgi:hypothetical protein